MPDWIKIATADELADGETKLIEVEDYFLVLARVDGQFYCIDDECTHDGGPLGEGDIEGFCVICPRHGARFDVRDGRAVTMPATQATGSYEVKVEGGEVYVRLP